MDRRLRSGKFSIRSILFLARQKAVRIMTEDQIAGCGVDLPTPRNEPGNLTCGPIPPFISKESSGLNHFTQDEPKRWSKTALDSIGVDDSNCKPTDHPPTYMNWRCEPAESRQNLRCTETRGIELTHGKTRRGQRSTLLTCISITFLARQWIVHAGSGCQVTDVAGTEQTAHLNDCQMGNKSSELPSQKITS